MTTVESRRRSAPSVRITARAGGLAIVSLFVLTLAISPMRTYLEQRSQLAGLQRQADGLAAANVKLKEHVGELKDPKVLEGLARQCQGLVKPGEAAFITVPTHGAPTPPSC
jgi:cell division protein FtsB